MENKDFYQWRNPSPRRRSRQKMTKQSLKTLQELSRMKAPDLKGINDNGVQNIFTQQNEVFRPD